MKTVEGGICAAKGFKAGGVHCGVRKNRSKSDLAAIVSDVPCAAAAVFTTNKVKAAPLHVTKEHLENLTAQAVIVNSANANACAPHGYENAVRMADALAQALGLPAADVIVASTGVIGEELNIAAIEAGVPRLAAALSPLGSDAAAQAILTTDLYKKEIAVSAEIGGCTVTLGGIAKGSGMIHPNMGTLLSFLTTDCAIDKALLQELLGEIVRRTFNRVSIDGDTSTNDTCTILANGLAGNVCISEKNADYETFRALLLEVLTYLAREIARDGEGASKLLTCTVSGAADEETAEVIAKAVIASSLVKAAMFGADANWGRVLCAMGYSGAAFDPETVNVRFRSATGELPVCQNGRGIPFDEALARDILSQDEVVIAIDLQTGPAEATAWGCDLTYDYVKINGDYRT